MEIRRISENSECSGLLGLCTPGTAKKSSTPECSVLELLGTESHSLSSSTASMADCSRATPRILGDSSMISHAGTKDKAALVKSEIVQPRQTLQSQINKLTHSRVQLTSLQELERSQKSSRKMSEDPHPKTKLRILISQPCSKPRRKLHHNPKKYWSYEVHARVRSLKKAQWSQMRKGHWLI